MFEIAIQQLARQLVVEPNTVEAHNTGVGTGEFLMYLADEFRLDHSLLAGDLGCDMSDTTGLGRGEEIVGRLTIQHQGLAQRFQRFVGTQTGKLGYPMTARIQTEGFIVVPVKRAFRQNFPDSE